jgi:hypothetical protein
MIRTIDDIRTTDPMSARRSCTTASSSADGASVGDASAAMDILPVQGPVMAAPVTMAITNTMYAAMSHGARKLSSPVNAASSPKIAPPMKKIGSILPSVDAMPDTTRMAGTLLLAATRWSTTSGIAALATARNMVRMWRNLKRVNPMAPLRTAAAPVGAIGQ